MVKGGAEDDGGTKKFGDVADLQSKHRVSDAAEAEKLMHRLPPEERRVRSWG